MASVGVAPTCGITDSTSHGVDRLPEEMNDMKIRDEKVNNVSFYDILSLLHL